MAKLLNSHMPHGKKRPSLAALAGELADASRFRTPVPPLASRFPGLALEDAYRIQRLNVARRVSAGGGVVGHKIGLTSLAMQQQMGIHEPDSGVVLDNMISHSDSRLSVADFMAPRIETEIAFRIGRDLNAPTDLRTVRASVAEVFLAFEVLDTCFTDWNITLVDSIADNAACARVIIGTPVPVSDIADVSAERITVSVNGKTVAIGEGRDILGDPYKALMWLTYRLPVLKTTLHAGDIVLAGSVHASIPLTADMNIRATSTRLPTIRTHTV
ncbi:2-keto-4-pentenoate hydratase [Streptomyces sp. KhCrAH-43]|uniref:2-keto-4-pentenoate hydratase n=1 Tax=unclassified Streptomyces TaxID=2593676 RepID=UPI0003817DB7|nr:MULTISPECIES: fumarylacetoacetate hydrolase family protein [unclassified Streptomyces]MYS36798.1 hydratase [Streptomyces sp. SID4920]MYX69269.1 hydratase [Streptomyces sp. SID8373]RAJ62120.1 2-keto-4-pentenoate hydratase [Streptomyces sp. KhCrAH-43]